MPDAYSMSPSDFQLLETAYERAALANSDRAAIIAELRSHSPDAASKLSEMLSATSLDEHTASDLLLELGMGQSVPSQQPLDHLPPLIDKYRILSILGEGGWGIVYLAEQPAPAHRLVAIKVIKPGMDSRQVLARFNDERQALAMMDHPCVVSSLDAGITAQGRPYVVMPLIAGLPINHFCKDENLSLTDRLSLFSLICRGIEHAHAKGVIHRDIKPGNILVARTDSGPVPRIIDFGLAKAMSQPLTPHATVTLSGQIIGTPDYMSPEQAQGEGSDVRSDVYSLGAVLYELLAGRTPFDAARLREAGPDGLRDILQNTIPPAPSTFASSHFARELDWITQRCLEKDPARRYPTAALADDIDRHLRGDRVNAGPPARLYRATRWMVKNRTIAAAAVLIAASIATGFWYTQQARFRAEQVAKVTRSILTSVDPAVAQGRDTELLFLMLDQSRALLDDPNLDPHVELDLREQFAVANDVTGRFLEAAIHAKRADTLIGRFESESSPRRLPMLTVILHALNVGLARDSNREARIGDLDRLIRNIARQNYSEDAAEVLRLEVEIVSIIRDKTPEQYRALLARLEKTLGHDDATTIRLVRLLAQRLSDENKPEATKLLDEIRQLSIARFGPDHPLVHKGIALELYAAGLFGGHEQVVKIARDRLPAAEQVLGWRYPAIQTALQNYAFSEVELGHCESGITLFKKALHQETIGRSEESGMARWICGNLAYAALKCDDIELFNQCESQLWRIQPTGPDFDMTICHDIVVLLAKRGESTRSNRWMQLLEQKNPGLAAEAKTHLTSGPK